MLWPGIGQRAQQASCFGFTRVVSVLKKHCSIGGSPWVAQRHTVFTTVRCTQSLSEC
jgi:hypothetical protein